MIKVKIFTKLDAELLEEAINMFISDKEVLHIDMKMLKDEPFIVYGALVVYRIKRLEGYEN